MSLAVLKVSALAALLAVGAIACESTRATSEWRDYSFPGSKLRRLLIIAIAENERDRRSYEDTFVAGLRGSGVQGVASWTVLPRNEKVSQDAISAAINDRQFDAVLVTHVVGVEDTEIYHPPRTVYAAPRYSLGYYDYYSRVYDYVYEPGYYTKHKLVRLESNLYETESGHLIWSMQSETFDPQTRSALIEENVRLAISRLKEQRLIQE